MRILLTTNTLRTGGAENFVVRLANELHRRRHEVVVMAAPGELATKLAAGVDHRPAALEARQPRELLAAAAAMRRVIVDRRIDLVHANSYNSALVARLATRDRPIPVVVSGHGAWKAWKKPFVARLFAWSGDRVVGCAADVTADLVRHGLPPAKARTIPNGIPFDHHAAPGDRLAARAALGLPERAPLVISAGRLTEQKGYVYLLDALAAIARARPDVVTAIAGGGELRAMLEARASALGLGDRVRFLGVLPDVRPALAAADVFCLPSIDEGLPLAIIEAMAQGLPVVATRVGGVAEAVDDGRTGWLVPARDPAALADRLLAVLAHPDQGRTMGAAGRRRVAEAFTLDGMVDAFEGLYLEARARR